MLPTPLLSLLLVTIIHQNLTAQDIQGYWLSHDSSRRYEIKKDGDNYSCILAASSRQSDCGKADALVLRNITYNKRKNHYSGEIISLVDGSSAFTRICIDKDRPGVLKLRIYYWDRLFACRVYWKAAPDNPEYKNR